MATAVLFGRPVLVEDSRDVYDGGPVGSGDKGQSGEGEAGDHDPDRRQHP